MKRIVAAIVLASATLASCSGGGFEGKWESTFGGVTLDLKPDHTVDITTMGMASEGTWEAVGKDKIVVRGPRPEITLTMNKDGDLTDGMAGRFVKQR